MRNSIICFLFLYLTVLAGKPNITGQTIPEENQKCLRCHTSHTFSIFNEWTDMDEKRLMNPFYILDTVKLAAGVHHSFSCIDCHSMDYETYPHNGELKLEPMMTCIDCHGDDPNFKGWQFERIEKEFHKSVHYEAHGEQFSCAKCHSQHYYRAIARTGTSLREIVSYSNDMCMSCHDNMARYQLVSDNENPKLIDVHSWLPNQQLHFNRVRCIECHTEVQDTLMVSHNIIGKEHARRNCTECHSANSIMKASLYKYHNLKTRADSGEESRKSVLSLLAVSGSDDKFSSEYYLIGASQIPFINISFAVIFFATLLGIIIHIIFRILKK